MIKSNDKIYIELFLENLVVRKNLSQNTIKSYTFDLKLLTVFFSQKCISSLTENELKIYIKHLSETPEDTIFLAKYLAAYAADLSTLVGSLPENAPPP